MKKMSVILAFILIFFVTCAKDQTIEIIDAEIIEYGIFSSDIEEVIEDESLAEGEHSININYSLIKQTDEIPGRIGTEFGFHVLIKGKPHGEEVTIDHVILYPSAGLKNPATDEVHHKDSLQFTATTGKSFYRCYTFEHHWEIVPGTWTYQLWYEGKKLVEKKFRIYVP